MDTWNTFIGLYTTKLRITDFAVDLREKKRNMKWPTALFTFPEDFPRLAE